MAVETGSLQFEANIDYSKMAASISKIEAQLDGLTNTANKNTASMENVAKQAALALGGYLSLNATGNFVKQIVQVRGEFQQLEVAFQTMLQSKEKADKLLADVAKLAATTPFELKEVGQGAKQLLAYGFSADKVVETLRTLGDIAAGVSAPIGDITYLYGTLRTQGRAFAKDIQQFTGRGIPIIAELAKQFGVAESEVMGIVEAGRVGFPEIEKAFKNLTTSGGIFFNLMEAQSKTLTGQLSNLSDAFDAMLNNLGKSSEGALSAGIAGLTYLVENYQTVIDILEVLAATYGVYKAAVIAVTVVERIRSTQLLLQAAGVSALTVAEVLHYGALVVAEKAQKLLNATMLSNPYVAVATALAAVIAAIVVFGDETSELVTEQELLAKSTNSVKESLIKQKAAIEPYIAILKDANSTEQERIKAYTELNKLAPEIVKNINAQAVSQEILTKNVDEYIKALERKYAIEANQSSIDESIKKTAEFSNQLQKAEQRRRDVVASSSSYKLDILPGIDKRIAELKKLEQAQRDVTKSLVQNAIETTKSGEKEQEVIKLSNRALIAQADTLERIKKVRDDIEGQYKSANTDAKRLELTKDLEAADARIKQLDPYSRLKESTKQAKKETEQLAKLLEKIADLERDSAAVDQTKGETVVDKIQAEVDKLIKEAEKLKAGEAILFRIKTAGKVLIDDANLKQMAKDILNQTNAAISDTAADIAITPEGTAQALALEKQLLDQRADLEAKNLEQQKDGSKAMNEYIQKETIRIYAETNRDKLKLDKDYNRRTVDIQLDNIKRQTQILNLNDERVKDDPTKTINERYAAQERIINRNRQALQKMLTLLNELGGKGTENAEDLKKEIEGIHLEINALNNELEDNTTERLIAVFEQLQSVTNTTAASLRSLASDLADINPGLSDTLDTMSTIVEQLGAVAGVGSGIGQYAKGNKAAGNNAFGAIGGLVAAGASIGAIFGGIGAPIGAAIGAIAGLVVAALKGGKKVRESIQKTEEAIAVFRINAETAEYRINDAIRQRNLLKAQELEITLENIAAQRKALELGEDQIDQEKAQLLAQLQNQQYITNVDKQKYGGFLGLWKKTAPVNQYASLMGMTFEEIEKLYTSGKLDGEAKILFEQLQQLQEKGLDVAKQLKDLQSQADEIFTGTTADSITDSIVQAFANGETAVADFADNFEDLMQQAILNAFKYRTLEAPLQEFYKQFAAATQSGDQLTANEISQLQDLYNSIIKNAANAYDQLKDITQIDPSTPTDDSNTLKGAIKGITEQQASLLAAQFGAFRITGMQQLSTMTEQLNVLRLIKIDTARLFDIDATLKSMRDFGIKLQ